MENNSTTINRNESDLAIGTFVEKWPEWIRWILFIPASFIVPILFFAIQKFTAELYMGTDGGIIMDFLGNMIMGGGIVAIGAMVAPRNQFFIGIIMLLLVTILGILSLFGELSTNEIHPVMALLHVISFVGSGVYALNFIHKTEKGEE